ncbi:unnamed protein product, partial [Meganyctiphanes norvegica]
MARLPTDTVLRAAIRTMLLFSVVQFIIIPVGCLKTTGVMDVCSLKSTCVPTDECPKAKKMSSCGKGEICCKLDKSHGEITKKDNDPDKYLIRKDGRKSVKRVNISEKKKQSKIKNDDGKYKKNHKRGDGERKNGINTRKRKNTKKGKMNDGKENLGGGRKMKKINRPVKRMKKKYNKKVQKENNKNKSKKVHNDNIRKTLKSNEGKSRKNTKSLTKGNESKGSKKGKNKPEKTSDKCTTTTADCSAYGGICVKKGYCKPKDKTEKDKTKEKNKDKSKDKTKDETKVKERKKKKDKEEATKKFLCGLGCECCIPSVPSIPSVCKNVQTTACTAKKGTCMNRKGCNTGTHIITDLCDGKGTDCFECCSPK